MAGKKERQRKLARERYERQQARRGQRAHRWRVVSIVAGVSIAVVGVGAGSYVAFAGGGSTGKPSAAAATKPAATPTPTPVPTPSASATPSLAAEPATHCVYTPSGTAARKVGIPPAKPHFKGKAYLASIKTNRGTIVVDLLNSKATCTVNSFLYLASKKYFSNTPCHRLTTSGIYVLQCGDPAGTGRGGPGYEFPNENTAGAQYVQGTVAMANVGPLTNGSQFFLVYRNSTTLPANYTPFGKIVSGLGIIQNVAKAGSDNANGTGDGHPKEKVTIESVTFTKA